MVDYVSTRGNGPVGLTEAVLRGQPPDGGLYVPDCLPDLPWPPAVTATDSIGGWAAKRLFGGFDGEVLENAGRHATAFPFPLRETEPGRFVLELFHGPTHAFKDVGARFMASLVSHLVGARGGSVTVLVATSGDTGGAVAHAFLGQPGTRVVALFPRSGVSDRQRRQMTTLGENVQAVAVDGTFDDCQALVKAAFANEGMREAHGLTSANSINIARLLPQAIYYMDAARRFTVPVHFVVPSGNLGNLCAGLIAARSGMPSSGFTAAFNSNRGVAEFLGGGAYEPRASVPTISNAMDVGAPSNLERILWLYDEDVGVLRRDVRGAWVSDVETLETIGAVYRRTGYLMDPHTAVAYAAASRHDPGSTPVVILATAHPGKFPDVVERAIGEPVETPPAIRDAMGRSESMTVIAPGLEELRTVLERPAP